MRDPIRSARSYIHACIYVHTDIPNTNTRACLARIPSFIPAHNAIIHTTTTTHSYEQAMYCTYLSVWSVELWASAAAICCAPFTRTSFSSRLCAHVCEKHVCSLRCAIPYTYNRERGHTHLCIRACRHMHPHLPSFQCTHTIYKRALLLGTHAIRLCAALT
jgi:hypothetical protein